MVVLVLAWPDLWEVQSISLLAFKKEQAVRALLYDEGESREDVSAE